MQVKLSSGKREILDHGTVFLFDENADLTLDITGDDSYNLRFVLKFINDSLQKQSIKTEKTENCIKLTCVNFQSSGTGLSTPAQIAVIDGKKIYIMFWSYLEGSDQKKWVRKVEYTLFGEE